MTNSMFDTAKGVIFCVSHCRLAKHSVSDTADWRHIQYLDTAWWWHSVSDTKNWLYIRYRTSSISDTITSNTYCLSVSLELKKWKVVFRFPLTFSLQTNNRNHEIERQLAFFCIPKKAVKDCTQPQVSSLSIFRKALYFVRHIYNSHSALCRGSRKPLPRTVSREFWRCPRHFNPLWGRYFFHKKT